MPLVKPGVKIENVVASATLKHRIDLSAVVKAFPVVNYQPEQFPGLIFKLKRPRTRSRRKKTSTRPLKRLASHTSRESGVIEVEAFITVLCE